MAVRRLRKISEVWGPTLADVVDELDAKTAAILEKEA